MPLRLQMEDLQHIITDKSAQLANRRTFNFVVAVFAFLVISSAALLVGILALATKPCTPTEQSSSSSSSSFSSRPSSDDPKDSRGNLCLTSGCLKAASGVLESMDPTVDPCDDFHQFACGGWIAKHSVPPGKNYISVFDQLFAESEQKLRETLESPVQRPAEDSSERKMKDFFSLCVHDYGRMQDGGKALVQEIREQLGGWYLLNPETWHKNWSFQDTLIKTHTDYGVPMLFNYYVSPDPKNRKRNIIGVQLPSGDVGDADVQSSRAAKKRTMFRTYIEALGTLMLRDSGVQLGDREKGAMDTFIDDVYNQERALTQLRDRVSEAERWEGRVITLRELSANFTQVDWVTIFTRIFEEAGVNADTSIALTSLPYFQGLEEMLRNESSTRDRMMNNYMVWTIVHTFADHLSWEYRQHKFSLLEKTTGVTEFPSTWHTCLSLMKTRMGFALAVELAHTHMADTGRTEVEKMVQYLKQSAQSAIDNAIWMDATTKILAQNKVNNMETEIGFPPILSEQAEVDELYGQLKVNKSESFFKNLIYASRFKRVLASIEYKTGYKYNLWEYAFFYNPLGVRPLYLWFYNTLIVPPGVFSYPLYTFNAPQAINFGALGSYIAARMVRSIDEVGRLVLNGTFSNWWSTYSLAHYLMETDCYVKYFNGRLVLNGTFHSWWSPSTLEGYEQIGSCFTNALVGTPIVDTTFNNSSVVIDGHYQVIRVVAETAGLRLAYGVLVAMVTIIACLLQRWIGLQKAIIGGRWNFSGLEKYIQAYKKWVHSNYKEASLPGLNMTADQLFFLATAQARCTLRRQQSAYELALTGALPVDVMLNTMVTHVGQFAEAFQCPSGSKMVPKERCGVFIGDID